MDGIAVYAQEAHSPKIWLTNNLEYITQTERASDLVASGAWDDNWSCAIFIPFCSSTAIAILKTN